MSDIAIRFENVGKLYRLGTVGTGTLSHDLKRWWITSVRGKEDPYLKIGETNDRSSKGTSDYVYALKDITFDVKQGDVLGIIGKNGAGKSTLLKLLSKVTAPTTGKIYTKGRIASLLEVGTGFHPELTGRENIYMNGTILGMKKWEIDKQLDAIVDFSGCERYLDTPVKRYSSGMTVRLGFAIAAHLNPEILVVDEVLAVGDAEFQKKAIGKMKDVSKGQGRTVLFVSHNMTAIRSLCNNGILLENGMLKEQGVCEEIVSKYLKGDSKAYNHKDWSNNPIKMKEGFELLEMGVRRLGGNWEDIIRMNEDAEVIIKYRLRQSFDKFWFSLNYKNEQGEIIFSSFAEDAQIPLKHKEGIYELRSIIPANTLNWGDFSLNLWAFHDNFINLANESDIISFTVANKAQELGGYMGKEPGNVTPKFPFSEMIIG